MFEKSQVCPPIAEIERLAIAAICKGADPGGFKKHMLSCPRCQYIWKGIAELFVEFSRGTSDESEGRVGRFAEALSRKEAIILTPLAEQSSAEDDSFTQTFLAADSDTPDDQNIFEAATLASEHPGALLRIMRHRRSRKLHFYLSLDGRSAAGFEVHAPELREPVRLDASGYGCATEEPFSSIVFRVAVALPAT